MKKFITLIQIAGLRRAAVGREREPIGEGEVIALPDGFARSLLDSGAIEPTDASETVELFWDQPVELIKSNDPEGLQKALVNLGFDLAKGPDQSAVTVAGISPTDVQALAQALEAQGAIVVLQSDDKITAIMPLLSGEELLAEVAHRIRQGAIALAQLPEEVLGLVAPAFPAGVIGEPTPATTAAEPPAPTPPASSATAEVKPAKAARKRG